VSHDIVRKPHCDRNEQIRRASNDAAKPLDASAFTSNDADGTSSRMWSMVVPEQVVGGQDLAKRPRVLIAEDHPGVMKAVCRLLAMDCDVVGSIADGSLVVEAAQRLQPDVIVVDLNLPNVNGLEACRQITQLNPDAKVIVFTAMNDPDIRRRCFEVGASAFVFKGSGDDLLSTVKGLCDDRD